MHTHGDKGQICCIRLQKMSTCEDPKWKERTCTGRDVDDSIHRSLSIYICASHMPVDIHVRELTKNTLE